VLVGEPEHKGPISAYRCFPFRSGTIYAYGGTPSFGRLPTSFFNDELLEYFDLSPCASPGLPPTIASLSRPTAACAASVQAIGDAARLIRTGESDVAICGGSEACIDLVSLGGFAAARALSTAFNETPARASRPFDRDRDGFVMGEGGILVIEELEHAIRRGAKPLAEIVGYGTTADAYHITSGPEDGEGARRAMEGALRQASLKPGDIQHLNAHSTSTPVGDLSELEAIKAVFGRDGKIAVSATKSATGLCSARRGEPKRSLRSSR